MNFDEDLRQLSRPQIRDLLVSSAVEMTDLRARMSSLREQRQKLKDHLVDTRSVRRATQAQEPGDSQPCSSEASPLLPPAKPVQFAAPSFFDRPALNRAG